MATLFFGAGGYLGKHLVQALRDSGEPVTIPMRPDSGRVDLTDRAQLADIDWNVDRVFVFAGATGTAAAFDNVDRFLDGNERALLNVLDGIRRSGYRPRVVFPSSRLVYRGAEAPLPETAPLEARTLYAANKIACENYLQVYANAWDIPFTVLRICVPYANSIGEQYSFGTVGNFISQARGSGRIRLYGGGELRRTFTHIEDLCRLTLQASVHPAAVNQIFNVPGEDLSLHEAATHIARRLGATIESTDWPAMDARIESGSTVFDGSRLTQLLGGGCTRRLPDWARDLPFDRAREPSAP